MIISASDQYKGVIRISEAGFGRVLESAGNLGLLTERDWRQYYRGILSMRDPQGRPVDPLLILAMFSHESSFGTAGVARQTHSWGNTRLPAFGPSPILIRDTATGRWVPKVVDGARGVFPVYRDWLDGCLSTCARLVTPDWVYTGWGRIAIKDIWMWADDPSTPHTDESELVWAPSSDENDPDSYLGDVIRKMNRWADQDEGFGDIVSQIHIGLSPGHADTGGDEWGGEEVKRTIPLTLAIRDELEAHGFRVTLQDPIPYRGTHRDVAQWFAARHNIDPFHCILQIHFEGTAAGVRGAFVVYPDAPDRQDYDQKARDLGLDIVKKLKEYTGMPIRGDGDLSENETAVRRLAWFSLTTSMKADAERLLMEYGASNSSMQDRAIVDSPGFYQKAARATREAFEKHYGRQTVVKPKPIDDHIAFPGTPYVYAEGFASLYREVDNEPGRHKGLRVFGIPKSPEFRMLLPAGPQGPEGLPTLIERTVQVCERGTMIWNEELPDPHDLTKSFGEWDALARAEARKRGYL